MKLYTNRDQRADRSRQVVDGNRPAPTFTAASGNQWKFKGENFGETALGVQSSVAHDCHDAQTWGGGGIVVGRKLHRAECPPRALDDPSYTIRSQGSGAAPGGVEWVHDRPATTIVGTFSPNIVAAPGHQKRTGPDATHRQDNGVAITLEEALILQYFPKDYPVQGSRTACFLQVGNAIPPGLARAVLSMLVGEREAAA
jgi:site-specific DNA-cytosine methylase